MRLQYGSRLYNYRNRLGIGLLAVTAFQCSDLRKCGGTSEEFETTTTAAVVAAPEDAPAAVDAPVVVPAPEVTTTLRPTTTAPEITTTTTEAPPAPLTFSVQGWRCEAPDVLALTLGRNRPQAGLRVSNGGASSAWDDAATSITVAWPQVATGEFVDEMTVTVTDAAGATLYENMFMAEDLVRDHPECMTLFHWSTGG